MASQFPPNMDRLMDKLASDDGFRARLMADPAGALGAMGIVIDAAQIPALRTLPSKQRAAAEQLVVREKLASSSTVMVPFLLSGRA